MQTHHLYATCASSTTMATRLFWYRVDTNIAHHFGLRIQDSGLPKIRLKSPTTTPPPMISWSLCTPSCAVHKPSFAASLTWSYMRATKGDTITIIALPDFGLPSFSLTIGNLSGVGPQHHLSSKCEPNNLLVQASVGKCREYFPQQSE